MPEDKLQRRWYIVIEGAIGVGKTTLARMLSEQFNTQLILEVFEENPFLAKFYQSRATYAFQTQMFFLLSRYRQQQQVPLTLAEGALISDYMFDKDRLFAQLNLAGDEWEIYQQIHAALARQIPTPDLVVYLQASTDVLMERITHRDRPYERSMDRAYIESLRHAYDHFFSEQSELPVLYVDTDDLNFVASPSNLQSIVDRIRSALKEGQFQPAIPQLQSQVSGPAILSQGRPLGDYQRFHVELDRINGFNANLYFNYLGLSEEMGVLGSVLAQIWRDETVLVRQGIAETHAREESLRSSRLNLESGLADCMTYLLKLANYAGIDLEKAYLEKMSLE